EAAAAGAASAEAARHLNAAIELAPQASLPNLLERLGQIWVGGDQAAEALERAYALGREQGLGPDQELRTLGQALIVRTRWTAPAAPPTPSGEVHRWSPRNARP